MTHVFCECVCVVVLVCLSVISIHSSSYGPKWQAAVSPPHKLLPGGSSDMCDQTLNLDAKESQKTRPESDTHSHTLPVHTRLTAHTSWCCHICPNSCDVSSCLWGFSDSGRAKQTTWDWQVILMFHQQQPERQIPSCISASGISDQLLCCAYWWAPPHYYMYTSWVFGPISWQQYWSYTLDAFTAVTLQMVGRWGRGGGFR